MLHLTASLLVCLVILASSFLSVANAELFDPKKCHLVDYLPPSRSFLFRGNQPSIKNAATGGKETFAHNEVYNTMTARAESQANATFPPASKVYIVDISFEWPFESGQSASKDFFAKNPKLGEYLEWILVGSVVNPQTISGSEIDAMLRNGSVWKFDQIPERLQTLRNMMMAGPPAGYEALAVYAHCAGGCDRTGEFMMSYQMSYAPKYTNGRFPGNFSALYAQDSTMSYGCGRASNYFCSSSAAFYCEYYNMFNASKDGVRPYPDCLKAFNCKTFGGCEPTL